MKRRSILILIALLTLTLCLGFTACKGDDPTTAYEKAMGKYGRFDDAVKYIDPRKE